MTTIKEGLAKLKNDHQMLIAAPQLEHLLTGAADVTIAKDGTITVRYSDGGVKTRKATTAVLDSMDADKPSLIALVEYVEYGCIPRRKTMK